MILALLAFVVVIGTLLFVAYGGVEALSTLFEGHDELL